LSAQPRDGCKIRSHEDNGAGRAAARALPPAHGHGPPSGGARVYDPALGGSRAAQLRPLLPAHLRRQPLVALPPTQPPTEI